MAFDQQTKSQKFSILFHIALLRIQNLILLSSEVIGCDYRISPAVMRAIPSMIGPTPVLKRSNMGFGQRREGKQIPS